jgi:hypothetical protein
MHFLLSGFKLVRGATYIAYMYFAGRTILKPAALHRNPDTYGNYNTFEYKTQPHSSATPRTSSSVKNSASNLPILSSTMRL